MPGVFFFLLFTGVVVFIFWVAIKRTRKRATAWSGAAQALGLDYVAAALPIQLGTLHGSCKECWVSVGLHTERSGRSSTTYTRFVVQYPHRLPLELRITRQGFLQHVAAMFGVQDIEVGDEEFDALVIIKGDDPDAVRRFLTLGRRLEIARLYARFERVTFDSKQIEALARGASDYQESLVGDVEALVGAATLLGGRPERAPAGVPELETPAAGELLETVPDDFDERPTLDGFLDEVVDSWSAGKSVLGGSQGLLEQLFEGPTPVIDDGDRPTPVSFAAPETPVTFEVRQTPAPAREPERTTDPGIAGPYRGPESQEVAFEVVEEAPVEPAAPPPEQPDVAQAFAAAFAAEPGAAVSTPASAPAPAPTPGTLGPGAEELGRVLFGDDASGYEVEQRFGEWQGRRVMWSGVLSEAQAFDLDFEMGPGAGTKVVFEIGEHVSQFGTTSTIKAVVRFPEGAHAELQQRIGQRVSFAGVLDKAKGLMKEICLTDGELVA
jgi:hypothetical protein